MVVVKIELTDFEYQRYLDVLDYFGADSKGFIAYLIYKEYLNLDIRVTKRSLTPTALNDNKKRSKTIAT